MVRIASLLALLAVLALGTTAVHAEPNTTVAVQPMLLVIPMVDATIEYQPTPRLGLVVRPGYGHIGIPGLASTSLYELGGAANVYLTRDFKAWHVGTEMFWVWGDNSGYLYDASSTQMTTASPERVMGVYGGYKWIGWKHLTAVVQLGIGRMDIAKTSDGPVHQVLPIGNVEVGYSF